MTRGPGLTGSALLPQRRPAPRIALVVLVFAAACAQGRPPPAPPPVNDIVLALGPEAGTPAPAELAAERGPITGWLRVEGNHILTPEGTPFHGRGANLHDTRSCDSCSCASSCSLAGATISRAPARESS